MEKTNDLDRPPLRENTSRVSRPGLGTGPGQAQVGLFKGVLVRCEEDRAYPPLAWRSFCGRPPELQQQQLLDPGSFPHTMESFYQGAPIWAQTDSLLSKDYLETTFVDIRPGSTLERKLLAETQDFCYAMDDEDDLLPDSDDSSMEDFSDVDSESSFPLMTPQDHLGLAFFSMLCCFWPLGIAAFYLSQKTNKASAQGDVQGASVASRQALWLSVLSIVFGIITYVGAVAALISYLSAKPP
ncbi:synapse differentiation-inducing gene protein 1 [Nematolebias whitei]|uniref:synapse differentiation-inducing gene protein 1 n=1 Tax=Nematolebias whitei TaxID=451745 RepID=UPI00189A636A|nr:synapse differentiation-inducing gene protein 1 [Nematolebias whitei]